MKMCTKMKKIFECIAVMIFSIIFIGSIWMIPTKVVQASNPVLYIGEAELTQTNPYTTDGATATAAPQDLGNRYALFDSFNNTLTLNNFINSKGYTDGNSHYCIYCTNNSLKIIVKGNSSIASSGGNSVESICIKANDIEFSGDGSLNVTAQDTSQSASRSVGIEATNITIGGCSIVVKGSNGDVSKGMYATHSIVINSGNVESTAASNYASNGAIIADTSITLNNGMGIRTPDNGKIGANTNNLQCVQNSDTTTAKHVIIAKDQTSNNNSDDSSSRNNCTHDYEWEVEKEPTEIEDGEAVYKCTKCGYISARQPLTAYQYYILTSTNKIKNAQSGSTVTISSRYWNSFPRSFFEQLAKRRDITVKIQFPYDSKQYEITIDPSQTINTSDSKIKYYGPKNLIGMYNGKETE